MTAPQPTTRMVHCPRCEIEIPSTATRCPGCETSLSPEMFESNLQHTRWAPSWPGVATGLAILVVALAIAGWSYASVTHSFVGLRYVALFGAAIAGAVIAIGSLARRRAEVDPSPTENS